MFPPSLQKNILELDRQISLLETECENIESKKEFSVQEKNYSKNLSKERVQNRAFSTTPICSKVSKQSNLPNVYSESWVPLKTSVKAIFDGEEKSDNAEEKHNQTREISHSNDSKHLEGKETVARDEPSEARNSNLDISKKPQERVINTFKHTVEMSNKADSPEVGSKKVISKRSILSTTEDSSDETFPLWMTSSLKRNKISSCIKSSKGTSWSNIFSKDHSRKEREGKGLIKEQQNQTKNKGNKRGHKRSPGRLLSLKESNSDYYATENKSHERWETDLPSSQSRNLDDKKIKPRSARTQKNDVNISNDIKSLDEKEIQCMLKNNEKEKGEFLSDLNASIKTLCLLISDLKKKSSQEKRNDVLNDMQNTLMKISGIKSINALTSPINFCASLKGSKFKFLEGEEMSILELKKTLFGVKKYCEELTEEKTALSDQLAEKNEDLTNMKNKEKEYLSLISTLKFNLEKTKEEAEEGSQAKKDLMILKNKFHEETKVVEALKKSHRKMQEVVENYVMENEKLKTQIRMSKLESQKYNVLLLEKEMEIKKYKNEIDSFQKKISEQLRLLRSKASEKVVTKALGIISHQTTVYGQIEVDSFSSETTFDKNYTDQTSLMSTKTSLESSLNQSLHEGKALHPLMDLSNEKVKEIKDSKSEDLKEFIMNHELTETEKNIKDGGFASCNSDESCTEIKDEISKEKSFDCNSDLTKVLTGSEKLRNSIDEMLQDMRKDCSGKFCPSSQNSRNSSRCTSMSTSSENNCRLTECKNTTDMRSDIKKN